MCTVEGMYQRLTVRGLHQRQLARRKAAWGDRMSDDALGKSLRWFAYRFVASSQAIVCFGVFVVLIQLGLDPFGYAVLALSVVVGLTLYVAGFRCAKQAGLDIARANGLPDRTWNRAMAITPTQFDAWLAKEKAKLSESGR
jgi:hypothetical protein